MEIDENNDRPIAGIMATTKRIHLSRAFSLLFISMRPLLSTSGYPCNIGFGVLFEEFSLFKPLYFVKEYLASKFEKRGMATNEAAMLWNEY